MRTYTFPGSDIQVDVDYKISSENGVVFEEACIDGAPLNTDVLFIKERIPSLSNPYMYDEKIYSLTRYFQDRLDNDEHLIIEEEYVSDAQEDRARERRAFRDAAE